MKNEFVEVIKKYAYVGAEIKEESVLHKELGISSLGMFSMISELEELYGVRFNIMDFISVKTVGQLYAKFESKA
jgi:acyl carrier protein